MIEAGSIPEPIPQPGFDISELLRGSRFTMYLPDRERYRDDMPSYTDTLFDGVTPQAVKAGILEKSLTIDDVLNDPAGFNLYNSGRNRLHGYVGYPGIEGSMPIWFALSLKATNFEMRPFTGKWGFLGQLKFMEELGMPAHQTMALANFGFNFLEVGGGFFGTDKPTMSDDYFEQVRADIVPLRNYLYASLVRLANAVGSHLILFNDIDFTRAYGAPPDFNLAQFPKDYDQLTRCHYRRTATGIYVGYKHADPVHKEPFRLDTMGT